MKFEEEYEDILKHMETAIIKVYRQNNELMDYDVETVLKELIRAYQAEKTKKSHPRPTLTDLREELYEAVQTACEWLLGRQLLPPADHEGIQDLKPMTIDEIIQCLKRIQKSVQKWTKHYGRQGYLDFVAEFIR